MLIGGQKNVKPVQVDMPRATGLRARCAPPMPSLHSNSQVSSLRRIDQRDQSDVGFSASSKPNVALVAKWLAHAARLCLQMITPPLGVSNNVFVIRNNAKSGK
jgi:hypothetical protein